MPYPLNSFLKALDKFFETDAYPYYPDTARYSPPSLTTLLIEKYQSSDNTWLCLDGDDENWTPSSEAASDLEDQLILEIPVMTRSMFERITQDCWPISRVINLVDTKAQMVEWVKKAYQQKFPGAHLLSPDEGEHPF